MSGLQSWLIQRVSAIILGTYTILLLGFWLWQPQANNLAWQHLFNYPLMKYVTMLVLLALLAHAWIGVWTITTDYIKNAWVRLSVDVLVYVVLLFYLIWGMQILWQ